MSSPALPSLLATLALALLSACGSGAAGDGGRAAPPETDLRVQYWEAGTHDGGETATLTCEPAGGNHPRPQAACEALAAHPGALEPLAGGAVCTQIFGGPETAVLDGNFRGETVRARFDRSNGCEIDRWDRLAPLLELGSG